MKESYCGPFLLNLITDVLVCVWENVQTLKFLFYKALSSHILSLLHTFYDFFPHPDCSFTLFHSAELAYLDLFTVFNSVDFSFEWNFIWNFWGLGKEQGNTLSRQRNWLFFPLSCYILGEKPRLCLQEAELWPRLMKEARPQPLEVILEPNWDED